MSVSRVFLRGGSCSAAIEGSASSAAKASNNNFFIMIGFELSEGLDYFESVTGVSVTFELRPDGIVGHSPKLNFLALVTEAMFASLNIRQLTPRRS